MSMLLLTSFGGRRNGAARSSAFADNCFQDNEECKKARILSCIILPGNEHIWFPTPSIGPAESQCPGGKRYFVWRCRTKPTTNFRLENLVWGITRWAKYFARDM